MKNDIFKPVVQEDKLHRKFKFLQTETQLDGLRRVVREWAATFVDRDGKIIQEFQTTFHSSLWELYLSSVFNSMKLEIDGDVSKDRPDFIINAPEKLFIEAVTAQIKIDGKKEEDRAFSDFMDMFKPIHNDEGFEEIMDEAITRYSSSVRQKLDSYINNYLKCDWVDEKYPYVIAIGSYDQISYGREFIYPMLALLYGEYLNKDSREFERLNFIHKPGTDSKIDIGLFHKREFENVSAIIFSCTVTIGKLTSLAISKNYMPSNINTVLNVKYNGNEPHFVVQHVSCDNQESLTDGLFVFHNPNAKNKISHSIFDHEDITQISFDYEEDTFTMKSHDLPLVSRVNYVTFNNQDLIESNIDALLVEYNYL